MRTHEQLRLQSAAVASARVFAMMCCGECECVAFDVHAQEVESTTLGDLTQQRASEGVFVSVRSGVQVNEEKCRRMLAT